MNKFAQGIHDRLVSSDVKRFVTQNRLTGDICSMDVLEAASDSDDLCFFFTVATVAIDINNF